MPTTDFARTRPESSALPNHGRVRRSQRSFALILLACALGAPLRAEPAGKKAPAAARTPSSAAKPSPEAQELARLVGTWDVVMTMRPTPDAAPITVTGLIAERNMVGLYLAEVMRPAPGTSVPDFRRTDYMTYNVLQARFQYVSMDTRAPIGIMFAQSVGKPERSEVTVYFDGFPNPSPGPVGVTFLQARHVDKREGNTRHFKQQYWSEPGKAEWLAVQYAYTRKP